MDDLAIKPFVLLWCFVRVVASRKGLVSEVLIGERFDCPLASKRVYTVMSELQCTHLCLHNGSCEVINYNTARDVKENCEVFTQLNACSNRLEMVGWNAMKLKLQESTKKVYKSCKEIYEDRPSSVTGVYDLDIGKHYCFMEQSAGSCGVGGWTLAMKVDGTQTTFLQSSALWTNGDVYNVDSGTESFYENEAKFSAFNKLAFNDVCIGMKVLTDVRWLQIPGIAKNSLRSIFSAGTERITTRGRAAWKGLMASSSLQLNCNKEGFNLKSGSSNSILMRLGYIANEQNDCNSCDSFIGMGSWSRSCGNVAAASPDNGNKDTTAMCYLLVK